jgi:protein-L-isoaspartate(D-aspartate) O-methyltransferase
MARVERRRAVSWSRAAHVLCGLVLAMCVVGCRAEEPAATSTPRTESARLDAQREIMVRTQIQARGVKDERVLAAMRKVPREEFVTADRRPFAFEDRPLPIGEEQTISQPYIVGLMTELLELREGEKVLEIGTGSGYQAAILAELTPNVYSIEILEPLATRAKETLARLGYDGIKLMTGDGYKGWPEYAPFDAIIVTCAPESVPEPLKEQLREGGRMVIPVGPQWTGQTLYVLRKKGGELVGEEGISVGFVPMVREEDVGK